MRRCLFLLIGIAGLVAVTADTVRGQELTISGVSVSQFSKSANTCAALGGSGTPPTVTVRHSKSAGTITITMTDRLNDGRTVNHGSTTSPANPSGTTVVNYAFLAPCNRATASGLKSAYQVTATSGGSSKTVLWARYP